METCLEYVPCVIDVWLFHFSDRFSSCFIGRACEFEMGLLATFTQLVRQLNGLVIIMRYILSLLQFMAVLNLG